MSSDEAPARGQRHYAGGKSKPSICPYCGSSCLVIMRTIGDTRVVSQIYQSVGENRDVLCRHCHRIWRVELVGWE